MTNNHIERSYSTRKGRPQQTVDNIIHVLSRQGARFEYRNCMTHMLINDRDVVGFDRQVQTVMDICTKENFYRDGLRPAIRQALADLRYEACEVYSQKETAHTNEQSGS